VSRASANPTTVTIRVNGETREVANGSTVDALLDALGARRDGAAVALNDDVVPRGRHAAIALRDGDRVEIIVAVAGG
jgi:sulfur carrier protein